MVVTNDGSTASEDVDDVANGVGGVIIVVVIVEPVIMFL